jgi:hypothetical protein
MTSSSHVSGVEGCLLTLMSEDGRCLCWTNACRVGQVCVADACGVDLHEDLFGADRVDLDHLQCKRTAGLSHRERGGLSQLLDIFGPLALW